MELSPRLAEYFLNAVYDRKRVAGMTHDFYRYPARFSPSFARAAIRTFSNKEDVVLDPFMGGGTTLVEAAASGRQAIGCDINALGVFVSRVKTTLLSDADISEVRQWADSLPAVVNSARGSHWFHQGVDAGYMRNLDDAQTKPLRMVLESIVQHIQNLPSEVQQGFARCALLRTAQWALDCRKDVPTVDQFAQRLSVHVNRMIEGMKQYRRAVLQQPRWTERGYETPVVCLNRSAIGIDADKDVRRFPKPKLILTSPPYPGVHIIYNRWQVRGRKETAAPFWIANCLDGNGESYYTFGSRRQKGLSSYFQQLEAAFRSIRWVAAPRAFVIQMIAFSDPSWQLERYLAAMVRAGFREVKFPHFVDSPDGRIWRSVPNRKWYAAKDHANVSRYEAVLFHQPDD